jgi:cyclohexanone monooxygenase
MDGTVWLTRCNNYFRAANGRVVTQWPRSARVFWAMTCRFKAGDYAFAAPSKARTDHVAPQAAVYRHRSVEQRS